jgi:4-hydroxy-tetrahydrodipicolinate synthase
MIPTLKAIIARHHDDPAWLRLRPPLVALSSRQSDRLWDGLAAAGFTLAGS